MMFDRSPVSQYALDSLRMTLSYTITWEGPQVHFEEGDVKE